MLFYFVMEQDSNSMKKTKPFALALFWSYLFKA